ncbi:MAG: lantipeptide [Synechococcus sp. EAC657]|nr:lantipeptide [Synechococcus sp. EAC657]
MSEEQLKAFLEKVKGDTSLQEKLKAADNWEAVVGIANEAGFSVSADDLKNAQSEVSDGELEGAAGGQQLRGCEPCSTWGWRHTSTESAREPCRM